MNSELIYQDLLRQYNDLSEQEKNAILIYKSSFFYHINEITKIIDFENKSSSQIFDEIIDKKLFIEKFEGFKSVILNPKNMVVRYSLFQSVNLNNILDFIDSLKAIYQILKDARMKIQLCDDLKVYRGISVKMGSTLENVSSAKLISTSIKIDDANDFIYQNKTDESHLYVLSLKKDTNTLVSPLTIVYDYEDSVSMLTNDTSRAVLKIASRGFEGQTDIILFNDDLEFTEIAVRELELGEDKPLIVHDIVANLNSKIEFDKKNK